MNYFAHGRHFVDDPYFLAGTAMPDWLRVVDKRLRVRSRQAEQYLDAADARVARLAAGIVQHHRDDAWFHSTRAFAELNLSLCVLLRERLPADSGFRPFFLGHILVEILLDATLIEQRARATGSLLRGDRIVGRGGSRAGDRPDRRQARGAAWPSSSRCFPASGSCATMPTMPNCYFA